LLVGLRQRLAQILQVEALAHIFKRVMADGFCPMDQMAPPSPFGLLGQIQITAHAQDHSKQQAD